MARLCDPALLGAVTVKSQAPFAWPGNQPPRLHPAVAGMVNSVGLQGRGIDHWVTHDLPALRARGARVIASLWGHVVDDYRIAAAALERAREEIVAIELNLSCPNTDRGGQMFATAPEATAEVVAAVTATGNRPPRPGQADARYP